ncbi:hypothetical protein OQA88_1462 [Cercophora sp. LCS_1]
MTSLLLIGAILLHAFHIRAQDMSVITMHIYPITKSEPLYGSVVTVAPSSTVLSIRCSSSTSGDCEAFETAMVTQLPSSQVFEEHWSLQVHSFSGNESGNLGTRIPETTSDRHDFPSW